ncbi:hypothetical protein RDV84_00250 [Lysobacter yananisis]|uniref:DUF2570 domain-containing protein n=1 Tax=Lysobacter yananisis TaxID=1003114 RepID=A0ABY9P8J0_9GAMM|nr:hypothetical protein [Lysobacter yananisis]WMT03321.1 hypothetical protein RDV84_00250 [Lysobacter yananisis]
MTTVMVRWALVLVLVAFGLGACSGYRWGSDDREALAGRNEQLAAERAIAGGVASINAQAVTSLQDQFRAEARRHLEIQKANQQALSARGEQIVRLERAAAQRRTETIQKAAADEDCAALRTLPVCAAVADRLWGEATAADQN